MFRLLGRIPIHAKEVEKYVKRFQRDDATFVLESQPENFIAVDSLHVFRVLPARSNSIRHHRQCVCEVMGVLIIASA